jgi:O-antigen/teichoic acid export membrane protein
VIEMILLLGLGSIVRSFSYLSESVCRARERLDLEGAAAFVNSGLYVGVTLILFYLGYSIRVVGWVYLGAASAQLVASLWFASRFIPIRASLPPWRELGSAALPYATTSLTMLAFAQIDVLILSVIESPEFVGSYAAVSRLLLVAGTLGALASAGVLPTAARFYAHAERQRFDLLVNEALRGALLVGGAAALGLAFIARSVVGEIYGDQFVDLYPLLRAGSIYLALSFAASILATMLTSIGRQGDRARSILISLASTVVLVLGLTPYFGLAGTVTAMVGSEFVLVGCLAWCLRSRLRWPSLTRTAVVLLTSGALATALHFALLEGDTWLNLAVATIVPLSAYVGLVFVGGEGRRAIRFIMTLRRGDTALG